MRVAVTCESTGTTSFALRFDVIRRGDDGIDTTAVRGHNVYVVVSTEDWAKRALPTEFRNALTSVAGQGPTYDGTVGP